MASTLELLAPSGLTLTVELYPHGSDTIANTGGDSLTEATNRKGLYTATISETLSGWHTSHVKLSGTVIAASDVYMVDGAVCRVRDHDPKADVAFVEGTDATDAIQAAAAAAIAAAGLSPSSGARTCVLTVDDGTDPLESASVRVTKGGESYVRQTNTSGQVTFNLDDGTWTVAITLASYVFAGDSLVVNGDETATYSMTANGSVPAPSTTAQCTGYGYVYDQAGAIESGVVIVSELTRMPSGSAKIGDDDTRNATSAADGLVSFTNLWIGGTYRFYRSGSSKRFAVTIDAADVDSEGRYPLPNFVG